MGDSQLQFPADYATAPTVLVPINLALMPYVAGALARLEDESLWLTDEDYQQAYTAIVALKGMLMSFNSAPANEVFAGPESGDPGIPAWRRLLLADLPAIAFADLANVPLSFPPLAHSITHSSGGSDPISPSSIGAAAELHTHVIDYGSLTNIPATFAPTNHASRHASGGADQLSYSALAGIPGSFNPNNHASRHASGGTDQISPASIGASAQGHTHAVAWADVSGKPAQFVAIDNPAAATGYNNTAKNVGTYTLNANTLWAVPSGATAVAIRVSATWATAGANLTVRPTGAATGVIAVACQVANQANHVSGIVALQNNSFDLQIFTANATALTVILAGYWV